MQKTASNSIENPLKGSTSLATEFLRKRLPIGGILHRVKSSYLILARTFCEKNDITIAALEIWEDHISDVMKLISPIGPEISRFISAVRACSDFLGRPIRNVRCTVSLESAHIVLEKERLPR
jgi:hypothetical protein